MTGASAGRSGESQRTRIRRNAQRAEYDLDEIKAVLDANQICHVAYVENAEPRIIPTLYMRQGDFVYLHGNRQAAVLRYLASGGLASISVIAVDGVVVARSGFHCSMNYRSVVLFGQGQLVPEEDRESILDGFVEAGTGKVLRGILRTIDKQLTSWNVEDPDSLQATLTALGAALPAVERG